MNTYVRLLAAGVLVGTIGLQAGCDQNEAVTASESPSEAVVGKRQAGEGLGGQLAADKDFQTLRKLLIDADRRARLKYIAGANLKADQAFARAAERKGSLSASDKSRLSEIRGLSGDEFQRIYDLRNAVVTRFPEILSLSEEELQDILAGAGLGKTDAAGKTSGCSECYYAYNSCVSTAEFRHSIEVTSCIFLIESVYGGTVCYLASLAKYLWTITSCSMTKQYCLSANGCLGTPKDTL